MLDDGAAALLDDAAVLLSLVCGEVLADELEVLGLAWVLLAAGLLVAAIDWSPLIFDEVEDEGLVVLATVAGLADVAPIAPALLAPVDVQ